MEGTGYTQIKKLGQGSFGAAWLVKRNKDGEKLVAKEVRLAGLSKAEKDSAKHEISMLRALKHPNITRYVDHFETRTSLFIVMEYANGGDLYTKIKSRRGVLMKESEILHFFVQICMALGMMHSQHVLHRDLKTQNVFLTQDGVVKLGDFGISTVLRGTYDVKRTVCGTPYYFSPELCQNKPYNNKSDVWALGCILYELTTLNHAFEGNSMKALMAKILKGIYPPIHSQYSKDLSGLIRSMLQTDPSKRPGIHRIMELDFIRRAMESLKGEVEVANKDKRSLLDEAEKRKAVAEAQDRQVKAKQAALEKAKLDQARKVQEEAEHQKKLEAIRAKMAADMKLQEERMKHAREVQAAKEAAAMVKRKEWEARAKARQAEQKRYQEKMDVLAKAREDEWNRNMEAMKKQRELDAQRLQQEQAQFNQGGFGGGGGGGAALPPARAGQAQADHAALFREQRREAAANRARALQNDEPPQQHQPAQYAPAPVSNQQREEPAPAGGARRGMSEQEIEQAKKDAYWQMRREAEANRRRLMDAGGQQALGGGVQRESPPPPPQQHQQQAPQQATPVRKGASPIEQQQAPLPPAGGSPGGQQRRMTQEEMEQAKKEAYWQMRKEAEANRRRLMEGREEEPKAEASVPQQTPPQQPRAEPKQWQTPDAPRQPVAVAVMDDADDNDDDDVDGDQAMHDFLNNEAAAEEEGGDHNKSRQADYSAMQDAISQAMVGVENKDEDFGDAEESQEGGAAGLPGRFQLDGQTLQLANVSAGDPLSYRIESLRLFLESAIGDSNFLKVYRLLDGCDNDQEQGDQLDEAKKILPRAHEKYLTLVVQLIVCEDFYNAQQNS